MIVAGVIADKHGLTRSLGQYWACPSTGFRRTQRAVTVTAGHGGVELGRLVHLELSKDSKLWALAELRNRPELLRCPWWFSYEVRERSDGFELVGLAVTQRPGSISLPALRILHGNTIYESVRNTGSFDGHFLHSMVKKADKHPRYSQTLTIANHPDDEYAAMVSAHLRANPWDARVQGEVERSQHKGRILTVS